MKKIYFFLLLCGIACSSHAQQIFAGNGKTGFGGPVGTGSLTISNDATTYNFSFTRNTGSLNDALVIYIDSKAGGFSSTAGFNDNNDGLRIATSGYQSASNKSILTFPAGFLPDYAIALDQGFAAIFELVNGGPISFIYIGSGNLTPTGNPNAALYSFTALRSQLGITTDASLKFLATYISTTAYRSNELIGDAGPTDNLGYTDYTATTFNNYVGETLPLHFINFTGKKLSNSIIQVYWDTEDESNLSHFEVLHSSDGASFSVIATIPVSINTATRKSYIFNDNSPSKGNNYYKINAVDRGGKKLSTSVLKINVTNTQAEIIAIKSKSDNNLKLKIFNLDKGNYNLSVINEQGRQVYLKMLSHNGINTTYALTLNSILTPGVYRLLVSNNNNRIVTSFISQ